jgi:hypothetical protein
MDYITISVGNSPVKVARGGSAQWTSSAYYKYSPSGYVAVNNTAKFSDEGVLTLSWSCSVNISSGGTYQLTGYHYY